jgi:hypothetical protein
MLCEELVQEVKVTHELIRVVGGWGSGRGCGRVLVVTGC